MPANVLTIPVKKPRFARRSKMDFLSPDELIGVLRRAREDGVRSWAMCLLAYSHGLRASEVCRLKLADIDIKNATIATKRLKGSLHTVQMLMAHRGQPLLDELAAIKEWMKVRPSDAGDALFVSGKGGHLSSTQFYRIFRNIAERADLPANKRHPHVLKHSLATHLIGQNVNLAKVGQFLGHKSISSTMKYVAVSDSEASNAAHNALMNIF